VKFFLKMRPEVFIQRAKYFRDKKTGKRIWGFTLIVTLLGGAREELRRAHCEGCGSGSRIRAPPQPRG
jgi:hypothetical protein